MLLTDHAHPTWVPGHPFKGGDIRSVGYLLHPDMKRFQIMTPYLFSPCNPEKIVGASVAAASFPSFGSFFSNYFGGASYRMTDGKCGKMLENMKKCYEGSTARSEDPSASCAYYIDGFRRMACASN